MATARATVRIRIPVRQAKHICIYLNEYMDATAHDADTDYSAIDQVVCRIQRAIKARRRRMRRLKT